VTQAEWVAVATSDKLLRSGVLAVHPKGVAVLLVSRDDGICAIANRCAHMGCPLTAGRLDGDVITCPCHDWRFNVRTGEFLDAPEISLPTYNVRLDGDDVLVEIPKE